MDTEQILKYAEQIGAEEAEVFCVEGKEISIEVERDEIRLAKTSIIHGLGVRAAVNGAVGFSSTNNPKKVREAVRAAVKYAGNKSQDVHDWKGFPSNGRYQKVDGVFDKRLHEIEPDQCINYAAEMIDGAKSVEHAMPASGSLECVSSTTMICNSNGISICESGTLVQGAIDSVARDGAISSASEFDISRSLNIDFYRIGFNASELAARSLNGVAITPCKTSVLFRPAAFAEIIGSTIIPSLNADNVQKGRSALCGKLGVKISSDRLNIVDDGLLAGGIGTATSDDEGTPSQRTEIIANGVLQNFLYDCYTAGKDNRESTGNGIRPSYPSIPSVGIRNILIAFPPGDIISETSYGILVHSIIGAHTANPVSGDFSVEARNAFVIRDGSICEPIRHLMVSGNIFELLQSIDGAGFDAKAIGNIVTPTVRVSNQQVIG